MKGVKGELGPFLNDEKNEKNLQRRKFSTIFARAVFCDATEAREGEGGAVR